MNLIRKTERFRIQMMTNNNERQVSKFSLSLLSLLNYTTLYDSLSVYECACLKWVEGKGKKKKDGLPTIR